MNRKRKKYLLFGFIILLLFIFIYCVLSEDVDTNFDYASFKNNIISSRNENKYLFSNMKLNDEFCSYDIDTDTCFFNFNQRNNLIKINTRMYLINDDVQYATGSGINTNKVIYDFTDDNEILFYDEHFYYIINVRFLNNPIVSINDVDKIFRTELADLDFEQPIDLRADRDMVFNLYSDDNHENVSSYGTYHVRGASSFMYDKKSYRFNLNDNYTIFSMKSDSDWILDAVYSDSSKVRNKLSSSMWNLMNNNQSIDNDLNGEFVELFVNGKYVGLYNLKEDIDSKRINVSDDGVIIRSISHLSDVNLRKIAFNSISMETVGDRKYIENFEIEKYTPESLDVIFKRLGKYYSSNNSYSSINANFDINNYINYKLFVALIMGNDNLTKNLYYSMQDCNSKILITPWDMDLTWGLNWSDNAELHSVFSMESSSDFSWMDDNIVKNMDQQTLSLMKKRYWELRKDVITMDTINGYLDSYKDILVNSGAAKRDSERWYEYDVENEIEAIREWASRRIQFLDEYFS